MIALDSERAATPACDEYYPCSQAQQRFWFEEQLHPGNPALNVAVRWRIEGELSHRHLEEAWRRLIARHAPLRTSFDVVDGEPVQRVAVHVPVTVSDVDLRPLGDAAAAEADRLAQREALRSFDLSHAPLLRVTRLRTADDVAVLLVTAHHTVCDGWSIGVLAREMGDVCAALQAGETPKLAPLATTYGDYAKAERRALAETGRDDATSASRRLLDGYKQFELLPDRPRPAVQTSHGAIATVLLPRDLTESLARLAAEHGCTLFMVAYAALATLFHRYTGETDIAVGTQVVGRDDVDVENLVGCFINTIPLRTDCSGNPSFHDLLERARDAVLDGFEARHVPLERLIALANPKRDLSRNALFSTNFIFQRSFIKNATYGRFRLVDLPSRSAGALYDLNVFFVERPEGWRLSCEYNTDLFEQATVGGLLERFAILLRGIADAPHCRLSALPLLSERDRRRLLVDLNATDVPLPHATVHGLIAEQTARTPNAVALVCGDRALTYAELAAATDTLAAELRGHGAAGRRVGLFLGRTPELVVGIVATLKSGAAYVPLDPAHPAERLQYIARDAGLSLVVTTADMAHRVRWDGTQTVVVDVDACRDAATPVQPASNAAGPDGTAYVMYTSGSTGRPKGVVVPHRAVVNLLRAMRERPGLSENDTLVAVTTIGFDIAQLELLLPLVTGARVVLAGDGETSDPAALLRLIRRRGATVMQATPVTWRLLIRAGWDGAPALRVLCGGEALHRDLAHALLARSDDVWNLYGPTETTIWSSALRVTSGTGAVPLGPPIANTRFYVRDASGELVPPGVPGELTIGGIGVADGYAGRPDLTEERFVADPFDGRPGARLYRTGDLVRLRADGCYDFLGRIDRQVKVRGLRIELEEIEAALRREGGIADAAVTVAHDADGEPLLRAHVVPSADGAPRSSWAHSLRARLGRVLPRYMVPSEIIAVPTLPRTANGKLDVAALREPSQRRADEADGTPRTSTEAVVASVVADLLRCERVGRCDDIFQLGFHSLLAMRFIARIRESLGVTLPLRTLFDATTVAALAAQIDARVGAVSTPAAAAPATFMLNVEGARTPLIFLHSDLFAGGVYCRRLSTWLGDDQPLIGVAPHGTQGLPLLPTVEAMARDYLPRIRALQPRGPYRLGGFCASGLVAYELARLLRAEGEDVEPLVLVNASALPRRALPLFDALVRRIGLARGVPPTLRESLCYHIARLHGALARGPASTAALLRTRLRALARRSRRSARLDVGRAFEFGCGARETETSLAHLVAALTYHPEPYDGDVALIWAIDQETATRDVTVGWAAHARTVRVHPIVGGHVTALGDMLDELGRAVAASLDAPVVAGTA